MYGIRWCLHPAQIVQQAMAVATAERPEPLGQPLGGAAPSLSAQLRAALVAEEWACAW